MYLINLQVYTFWALAVCPALQQETQKRWETSHVSQDFQASLGARISK